MSRNKEYILEFTQVGNSVKVSAVDPITTAEAVIVGSLSATREELSELAIKKLEYVLAKIKSQS